MSEIVKPFRVRLGTRHRAVKLTFCFDSGSPTTFITQSAAEKIGPLMELGEPKAFGGLGNGRFFSHFASHVEIRILKYWCNWIPYVVPDVTFQDRFDMLIGHDFMQKFGVELIPRRKALRYDKTSLAMSQFIL